MIKIEGFSAEQNLVLNCLNLVSKLDSQSKKNTWRHHFEKQWLGRAVSLITIPVAAIAVIYSLARAILASVLCPFLGSKCVYKQWRLSFKNLSIFKDNLISFVFARLFSGVNLVDISFNLMQEKFKNEDFVKNHTKDNHIKACIQCMSDNTENQTTQEKIEKILKNPHYSRKNFKRFEIQDDNLVVYFHIDEKETSLIFSNRIPSNREMRGSILSNQLSSKEYESLEDLLSQSYLTEDDAFCCMGVNIFITVNEQVKDLSEEQKKQLEKKLTHLWLEVQTHKVETRV